MLSLYFGKNCGFLSELDFKFRPHKPIAGQHTCAIFVNLEDFSVDCSSFLWDDVFFELTFLDRMVKSTRKYEYKNMHSSGILSVLFKFMKGTVLCINIHMINHACSYVTPFKMS